MRAGCQQASHPALGVPAPTLTAPVITHEHFPGGLGLDPQPSSAAPADPPCPALASFLVAAGQDTLCYWFLRTEGSMWWCIPLPSGPPVSLWCRRSGRSFCTDQQIKRTDYNYSCVGMTGWWKDTARQSTRNLSKAGTAPVTALSPGWGVIIQVLNTCYSLTVLKRAQHLELPTL